MAARAHANGGKLKDCLGLNALFVDIDFKDLPEAEARLRIAAFKFLPSIISSLPVAGSTRTGCSRSLSPSNERRVCFAR